MVQGILVGLLFTAALVYLGQLVYKQFTAKSACATGCNKCGAVDFEKIEKELKAKSL